MLRRIASMEKCRAERVPAGLERSRRHGGIPVVGVVVMFVGIVVVDSGQWVVDVDEGVLCMLCMCGVRRQPWSWQYRWERVDLGMYKGPRRVRGLQVQVQVQRQGSGWATTTWADGQGRRECGTHTTSLALAACACARLLPHPPPPPHALHSTTPQPCIPSPRIRAAGAPPADCIQSPSGLSTALWPILTLSCRQSVSASLVVTEPTTSPRPSRRRRSRKEQRIHGPQANATCASSAHARPP